MLSNVCVVCRKVFSRRSNLARHINNRQTSCQPVTHHCDICDKGLSSYQTLWEHRRKCLSSPEFITQVINDSAVSSHPFADGSSAQSSPLKVIPYTLSLKDSTPTTHNQMETPARSQKMATTLSHVNDTSSDDEDENEDGEDVKRLFTQLEVLSTFIRGGYRRLGPAIVDTIDELYKLDGITDDQYHRLTDVFHPHL